MIFFFIIFIVIIVAEYLLKRGEMEIRDKIFYWVFSAIAGGFSYWYFLHEYKGSFVSLFLGGN